MDAGREVADSARRAVASEAAKNEKSTGMRADASMLTGATVEVSKLIEAYRDQIRKLAPAPYMKEKLSRRQQRRALEKMDSGQRAALFSQYDMNDVLDYVKDLYGGKLPPPAAQPDPIVIEGSLDGPSMEDEP